ncbi:LysR family transcriptional regulator, partial [Shigella flexneri]
WNEQTAGLASGWWRDEILANSAIAGVYAKSDDGKSAIQRKIIMTSLSFSCHFPPI